MFAVEFLHFFPLEASTLALDLIGNGERLRMSGGPHPPTPHAHTPAAR